jgi:hypothetical protein
MPCVILEDRDSLPGTSPEVLAAIRTHPGSLR